MQINDKNQLVYSVYSGTFYNVLEKDIKHLIIGQIPLKKQPPQNCKKCYGRGHLGREQKTYTYEICNCIRKNIDFDLFNSVFSKDLNIIK